MLRIAAACLAAVMLCTACLTKEDLDCWYDDMCMNIGAAPHATPTETGR